MENKKTSILVVDDVPAILQIYSEILRVEGYEVWEASTGQQGLQAARERRPDLVLLDVMLPDLSGIEVCRQIKADASSDGRFRCPGFRHGHQRCPQGGWPGNGRG